MTPTPFRAEIDAAAAKYGLDADLLDALVWQESGYHADAFRYEPAFYERYLKHNPAYAGADPRRVSSSYGLCQVMFSTAREHGLAPDLQPEYLFLPNVNLDLGAKILAELLKTSAPRDALARYNGGANFAAAGPQHYAASVLGRYEAIRKARGVAS